MFDSSYIENVNLVDKSEGDGKKHIWTKTYSFKGSVSRYVVEVERYDHDVYIIKFYLKAHKNSDNKYNLLAEENDAQGVSRTVLDIAIDILHYENRNASFGFIGAHKIKGEFKEEKYNTQRFRVYKYIMTNFFGDVTWRHYMVEETSAYLMLNKCHRKPKEIVEKIVTLFRDIYNEFDDCEAIEIRN